MKRTATTEAINYELRQNELSATDWELNGLAWELYWWCDFFNIAFFKDQPAPIPVLTFEKSRITTLGHYRIGRNDFGVREQINLNKLHLHRPLWDILATLLHEMVHSWEYTYVDHEKRTKNWYHTKTFRNKLASFGILTNNKGQHVSIGGNFVYLLKQHGISFQSAVRYGTGDTDGGFFKLDPDKGKKKGSSKLKKWSCGCTNVRVAIADFEAKCLKCGNDFELCA